MATYVYTPYRGDTDGKDAATAQMVMQWFAGQVGGRVALASNLSADGHYVERSWGRAKRPLAIVKSGDTLMINVHGEHERNEVGSSVSKAALSRPHDFKQTQKHGNVKSNPERTKFVVALTPNDVAYRLQKDGLPKTHERIELLSCCAAGVGQEEDVTVRQHFHGGEPFAQELARCLGKIGYSKIRVAGYQGEVVTTGEGIFYANRADADVYKAADPANPAAGTAITYDAGGKKV